VRILRWIGERPRECACEPPPGFQFGRMAACRRKLVHLGLAALDCPPGLPCVYLLTAAGEARLAELVKAEAPKRPGRKVKVIRRKAKAVDG
jgi:hypothetical protein